MHPWLPRQARTSEPRSGVVLRPRPCRPHPFRRRPTSRRCGSERWSGQSYDPRNVMRGRSASQSCSRLGGQFEIVNGNLRDNRENVSPPRLAPKTGREPWAPSDQNTRDPELMTLKSHFHFRLHQFLHPSQHLILRQAGRVEYQRIGSGH